MTIAAIVTQSKLQWDRVADLAAWHRSSGLLRHHLEAAGVADRVPKPVAGLLRSTYSETVARNLRLVAELERLLVALSDADVAVVVLKGAALLGDYYADVGLRPMSDLDLLVQAAEVERADLVLRQLGYREPPKYSSAEYRQTSRAYGHHLAPLVSSDGLVTVELHHRLGSKKSLLDFEVHRLWARTLPVTRGSACCLAPSPADLLIHACLHFLHHHVFRSYGALGQLADVALLVKGVGLVAIDWDVVVSEGYRLGVSQSLHFVLVLAKELLGAMPTTDALSELGRHGSSDAMVEDFVRRRIFRANDWKALEEFCPRRGALRQLLPLRPHAAWMQSQGKGHRAGRVIKAYVRWAVLAGRLAIHPRSIGEERAFERKLLEVMVLRHGHVA